MHNDQDERGTGIEQYRAQRVPSLLPGLVDAVWHNQAIGIVKNLSPEFEADAVVFALVEAVFALVPLVALMYIHNVSRFGLQLSPYT